MLYVHFSARARLPHVVGAPRERNGCRGSSLQSLRERNGNNDTQCKRGTSTVDTPRRRGRDAVAHPWTPCQRRRRLQRSRRDHVRLRCALTALLRRCRRSHCAPTATLRCSQCAHIRTPSHGAYFEHAQSARRTWHGDLGVLTASNGDATELLLHSGRPHCAHVAPLNVKTTLNVKTAKCEKPNNR